MTVQVANKLNPNVLCSVTRTNLENTIEHLQITRMLGKSPYKGQILQKFIGLELPCTSAETKIQTTLQIIELFFSNNRSKQAKQVDL